MAERELVIRISLPRWTKRRWILTMAGFLGISAVAYATSPLVLYVPKKGEPLLSGNLGKNFTDIQSAINALDTGDRNFRAQMTQNGGILDQTGNWLTLAGNPATGVFTYTITPGTFSKNPACVATGIDNGNAVFQFVIQGNTLPTLRIATLINGAPFNNSQFFIICQGLR